MTRRRRWLTPPALIALAASAVAAWAFWASSGTGSAAATSATLAAATITTPSSATNSITVTWTAQATLVPSSAANSAITYSVERQLGSGSFTAIASGGCSGAIARGTATCADVPPATGSYSYRVVATFHSWTAVSGVSGPVSFLLDTTPPTAQSIVRLDGDPTNASTVRWTATFSESVTGVGSGDFALARTGGVTGGSITGVTGSGATYTVTSSTGSGDGTLGLNLVDDDSIVDVAANSLGGSGTGNGDVAGQAYAVDRTAPALTTLAMRDVDGNGRVDRVTATFAETLSSSTLTAQWTLANAPSGAVLASVSTSGAVATLNLSEGAGAIDTTVGSFTVALATNATGIRDAAGNLSSFAATAPADGAAPLRTALQLLDVDANGKVDRVTATFSETLSSSTTTTPWTLANVPSAGSLASVSTSGAVATLVLTEGTGGADTAVGSFTVALATDASGIRDATANQSSFAAAAPSDGAAPARSAMQTLDANANGKVDGVSVTFSETLASSTTTTPWTLASVPSAGTLASVATSGAVATLTITEGAGAIDTTVGSFTVALATSATGIRDAAANQSSFSATAPADGAAPLRTALQMLDVDANGKVDRVTATFTETLSNSTTTAPWTLASAPSAATLSSVSTSGAVATVNLAEGAGTADTAVGSFTVALATGATGIRDGSGNQSSFAAIAPADAAAPAKTNLRMLDNNANGKIDRVTASFSETISSSSLTTQWTLTSVPSAGSLSSVSTSTSVATLTLAEGAGAANTAVGSFRLALVASGTGIRDAGGNQSSFASFAPLDNAGPVPVLVTDNDTGLLSDGKLQNGDTMQTTFSEAIASGLVSSPQISESKVAGADAYLTIGGFTNGALDMGSGSYLLLATTIVFDATATLSADSTVLTITAGICSTGCILTNLLQGSTGGGMDFVAAPALLDGVGNAATGTYHTGFPLF